jgi:putative CocE/NonD family hydrolase
VSLLSRGIAIVGRLPRAHTHRIEVERDLAVTMPDGVVLLADRYVPADATGLPIVLLRVPYGRVGFAALMARLFAERGYQVVIQEVRGTGVSGGTFNALRDEREDGLRTLDWIAEQPWFSGAVGMTGLSYLGHVQWAVAADAPPFVKALAIHVFSSEIRSGLYHGENFALYTTLRWVGGLGTRSKPMHRSLVGWIRNRGRLDRAFRQLPLREADAIAAGEHVGFFQDWLVHTESGDPFWAENDYSLRRADVTANVSLVAGWYDLFLTGQLADYAALRAAGREVRLTVGPWHHTQLAGFFAGVRDGLDWLDTHLRGVTTSRRTAPVRIYVMGARQWRTLPDWPPPSSPQPWYLHATRVLGPHLPTTSAADRYRYDPANPTPSVGGILLRADAGKVDDREKLESRADVLTYTSAPLRNDLEAIGEVSADLFVRASRPNFDLFVRICDVAPNGRSVNVCDGPLRIAPERNSPDASGVFRVRVELWPTAYRFRRGNRVRVHVASGAHPRISRNLGGGEPLASATEMHSVDIEILHDPEHPSAVILPVAAPTGAQAAAAAAAPAAARRKR